MQSRSITEDEVDRVLAAPETTYPSNSREDRTVVLGTTKAGRRLKVVVLTDDPEYVITVADRDDDR